MNMEAIGSMSGSSHYFHDQMLGQKFQPYSVWSWNDLALYSKVSKIWYPSSSTQNHFVALHG